MLCILHFLLTFWLVYSFKFIFSRNVKNKQYFVNEDIMMFNSGSATRIVMTRCSVTSMFSPNGNVSNTLYMYLLKYFISFSENFSYRHVRRDIPRQAKKGRRFYMSFSSVM